jgi:hypothetical protein
MTILTADLGLVSVPDDWVMAPDSPDVAQSVYSVDSLHVAQPSLVGKTVQPLDGMADIWNSWKCAPCRILFDDTRSRPHVTAS